jgi:hypothetical protein
MLLFYGYIYFRAFWMLALGASFEVYVYVFNCVSIKKKRKKK